MEPSPRELLASWQETLAAIPVIPLAFSIDGRTGELNAPLGTDVELGGFVVIEAPDDRLLVGQVRSREIIERASASIDVETDADLANVGKLQRITAAPIRRMVGASFAIIGRLLDGTVRPEPHPVGFGESFVRPASSEEISAIGRALGAEAAGSLRIGTLQADADTPATLAAKGFARHTFLCGQSGSGKTYTTGVLLERLRLETSLPIIVLDPNSDHVNLGAVQPALADDPEGRRYGAAGEVFVGRGRDKGGALLAVHFSDLVSEQQARALGIDPLADLDGFAALVDVTSALSAPYTVADVAAAAEAAGDDGRRLARRIQAIDAADWGIWCRPGEESIAAHRPLDNHCIVIDLGSLDRPEERLILAGAVLRRLWEGRHRREPVLVVIDEAHNVLPATPDDALAKGATDVAIAIAAEGRKFGIHLLVATQRPTKVHQEVVSQCDNLVLLRLNSIVDVEHICRGFSHVPRGLIESSPTFGLGEVLFAGPIAPVAVRARVGRRLSPEGGSDLPTDWANQPTTGGQ